MSQSPADLRADSLLTSYQVGALLQVNPSSVNKWVKDGRIPAFRTPGGHRRIRAGDLVAFLSEHKNPKPPGQTQAARQRLLLVSEVEADLQTITVALAPYADRVEVHTAAHGVAALVAVGSVQPHVVVLDVDMGKMDGIDICRQLHASSQTQSIGIVMVSPQLTAELQQRAKAAGAQVCITKPIELEALLRILKL
jgi:excisionase family DNA binding protein